MTQNVYTVKQVNAYIKNMFTQDYMLGRIYVKGEVSNCKYHTSVKTLDYGRTTGQQPAVDGHIYFSLKDESGTIACVMFAGQRGGLSFRMQEGQQVIVFGGVNVYERSGSYQLYAREIRLDGEGVLFERFQALKRELEERGMFAPEYKKPIPAYASRIGVVTAPTGAAVRDIINISRRRNPYVQLILYPAQVQGEGAKESIVRGIAMLDRLGVDVIIVGRGGGSMEDLWAFNEEEVARAIFNCPTPVISAVGHETDTTISDFVADLRAPTPSAAAELAVYDLGMTMERMRELEGRMGRILRQKVELCRSRLKAEAIRLENLHPRMRIADYRQRLMDLEDQMRTRARRTLLVTRHRMELYVERMRALSPLEKLNQGYAYVRTQDGKALRSIHKTRQGDVLEICVTDGSIRAEVLEKKEEHRG